MKIKLSNSNKYKIIYFVLIMYKGPEIPSLRIKSMQTVKAC